MVSVFTPCLLPEVTVPMSQFSNKQSLEPNLTALSRYSYFNFAFLFIFSFFFFAFKCPSQRRCGNVGLGKIINLSTCKAI